MSRPCYFIAKVIQLHIMLIHVHLTGWHGTLTAAHTNGPAKRKGIPFQADEDIPAPRVDTYDYMRSGYDRGHMCPAADNHWSQRAMEQSFLMTNVCPQNPALNSGLWNSIENQCRTWAEEYGDVYIVCGPIYLNQKHKTIYTSPYSSAHVRH